jgi:predicted N-acetyltransferase YhbS
LAGLRNIQIQIETDSNGTIAAEIEAQLVKALRQNVPPNDSEPLILVARDETDLVGGLIGSTSYGWLLVKILWVAEEVRRRGLGTSLMAQAEALARAKGCHSAWLDTSAADAERFYIRLGYKRFGVLENTSGELPRGHRRAFLAKRFARAPSEPKDG